MAAIAKFVSFDGGVAFSDQKMKVQKRGQEAVIMPLEDVAAVRVRRPQEDADGFVRVDTVDGQRFRIGFEDDQLQEAVRFKRQFDAFVSDEGTEQALAPVPEKAVSPRPARAPKQPIFKKWWFWAACALLVIVVIGIIVAGSSGKTDGANGTQPGASGDVPAGQQTGGAVTVGDYAVEIKDAFKTTDYEGKAAIVITYTWTNNSDDTTSAMVSLMEKAFQDGVQLESAILYDVDGYDPSPYMMEIRPGVSLDVQQAFVMKSNSPIEVEVSDLFGFADPATKTFDPNNL